MEYTADDADIPITEASLIEKSAIIGRCGLELLSCGTGAWRVRSSMNTLSRELGVTCTVDIGLMSLTYNCFDGEECVSQSLCLTNTGVNTSKMNRLEQFVADFPTKGIFMTGAELHAALDDIEHIHGLYSPAKLGLAAALACGGFTFLLGGLERLSYALIIILVATLSAWIMALLFHLCPLDFEPLGLIFARILSDKSFRYCT